jgi:catechol 2,3-dioxygenase-like lactoylglutathione lyase family enzyme
VVQRLDAVTLVVRDYDEAIEYYTTALGFALVEDTPLGDGKRWVMVAPRGAMTPRLLLAQAATQQQADRVGDQAGDGSFSFCTATISGAIFVSSSGEASDSGRPPGKSPTAPWSYSRTCTENCGTCSSRAAEEGARGTRTSGVLDVALATVSG